MALDLTWNELESLPLSLSETLMCDFRHHCGYLTKPEVTGWWGRNSMSAQIVHTDFSCPYKPGDTFQNHQLEI